MDPIISNVDCNIMVFRPTMEEFENFSEYVKHMESKGAHKAGVAKIIPPQGWVAARQYNMRKIGELVIETPVAQTVTGHQGLFQLFNVQKKSLKVKEFKELAESTKYKGPIPDDNYVDDKVERQYWKNITFNQPIYGADVPGSIYDTDVEHWNITRLGTILDLMGTHILGVNTPYLYFGMWKTTFPWHTEDMDLYSINYLHFGAPKSWYAIAPEQGKRLETLAKGFFSGSFQDCSQFLRHKMTIISPHVLKKFSIPVQKITQYEGEFMITFPYGYHSGYNHGFNCAESTNFASERWIEFGRKAKSCQCKPDSVKIDMDIFIRKYRPEEWMKLQQERRKDEDIAIHNKRKTARANYSSESKPLKLKVFTGRKSTGFDLKKKIGYKLDKSEEETDSDDDSSTSDGSDETTDSENSTDDQDELFENNDEERHTYKVKTKGKLQCNYNRDMHKKEIVKKKNQCSRRYISTIHKTLHNKDVSKKNAHKDNKDSISTYHTSYLLKDLWSHMRPNKTCERTFNKFLSSSETKCAVCVYFSQTDSSYLHHIEPTKLNADNNQMETNHDGKLLVTELCFAMDTSEENSIETAFNLMFGNINNPEELSLFTCVDCNLTVHNSCYGIYDHDKSADWYCDKCKVLNSYYEKLKIADSANCDNYLNDFLDGIKCSLCCIRAGALKETTTGGWCHIVCAIGIPEVFFLNKKDRGPIDISTLNPARKNLHCLYCGHLSKSPSSRGACIQCKCGKCATAFHVTCSFHHGIPLYLGDWPVCVETLCPKHSKFKVVTKVEKRSLREVTTDDLVFAKHKNGRYYRGKVIDIQMILYYKVVFDDKSFCFDLPPDDIQGVDAKTNIIPAGEMVDILWPDSMTYRAEVTGHWYETLCQIRFEDASILHVKRCDLYVDGEEIPKKIQSKLSYASETKNKFFLPAGMNTTSKRARIESWRYKNKDTE